MPSKCLIINTVQFDPLPALVKLKRLLSSVPSKPLDLDVGTLLNTADVVSCTFLAVGGARWPAFLCSNTQDLSFHRSSKVQQLWVVPLILQPLKLYMILLDLPTQVCLLPLHLWLFCSCTSEWCICYFANCNLWGSVWCCWTYLSSSACFLFICGSSAAAHWHDTSGILPIATFEAMYDLAGPTYPGLFASSSHAATCICPSA